MNAPLKRIFLFAGEPSGDLHGSHLAEQLAAGPHRTELYGIGGPKMREQGIKGPLRMEDFEVMGFTDVIRALPRLCSHFYTTRNAIIRSNPDAVVLIDYPGFNLRLAKALRQQGFSGKIIHYISPSVWAWGKHRINDMEKNLDLLLTIYPFEASCYAGSTLPVEYVGSPLKQYIADHSYVDDWKERLGIDPDKQLIALFPGSRRGELKRNLPLILQAASLLKTKFPALHFGISCASEQLLPEILSEAGKFPEIKDSLHTIPKGFTYELMRDSTCAIAKSGTVTLELAIHECPTVVFYKLTRINRLYAKYFLKLALPFYGIVNILAGKELFPELIEHGLTAKNLAQSAENFVADGQIRRACIQGCQELKHSLGTGRPSCRAAKAIMEAIH